MNYSKFDSYLGETIRNARVIKRITQDDMAKKISNIMKTDYGYKKGMSRAALSYYENGDRSMPDYIFTIACNILGLDEIKVFNDACEYIKKKEN